MPIDKNYFSGFKNMLKACMALFVPVAENRTQCLLKAAGFSCAPLPLTDKMDGYRYFRCMDRCTDPIHSCVLIRAGSKRRFKGYKPGLAGIPRPHISGADDDRAAVTNQKVQEPSAS